MKTVVSCLILLCCRTHLFAQEEQQTITYGKKYIELNVRSLYKYTRRVKKQQSLLLKKLKRKESRFAEQLKRKDSIVYLHYKSQPLTYDSISTMLRNDRSTLISKSYHKTESVLDTLKGIQQFLKAKAGVSNTELDKYSGEFATLQQKLNYQQYISDLITQHTKQLENLGGINNSAAISGITKQFSYYKMQVAAWKELADEPDKVEEKAFEILQGTKGFDKFLNKSTGNTDASSNGYSADDLAALGFQTKAGTTKALQDKLGGNAAQFQQKISGQVSEWQNKAQDITSQVKEVKQTAKNLVKTKPTIQLNPMRGRPFKLRLEKQYAFTTTKAHDATPAILSLSAGIGYRQSPKFSFGLLAIGNIGLGKSWSNIHFSMQGVGASIYLRWQWIYGIGCYGSYERCWKQNVFTNDHDVPTFNYSQHNTSTYTESLYIGLEKQYRISKKLNGSVLLLYDLYWSDKGLPSPFQIRIVTLK